MRETFEERRPPVRISEGVLKVWFAKQAAPPRTVTASNATELDQHQRFHRCLWASIEDESSKVNRRYKSRHKLQSRVITSGHGAGGGAAPAAGVKLVQADSIPDPNMRMYASSAR